MDQKGEWILSPAYDLTFAPGPGGEHAMTIDGEGKSPARGNIMRLGEKSGLKKKDVNLIIDNITQIVSDWPKYAETAGVTKTTQKTIHDKIRLNLS